MQRTWFSGRNHFFTFEKHPLLNDIVELQHSNVEHLVKLKYCTCRTKTCFAKPKDARTIPALYLVQICVWQNFISFLLIPLKCQALMLECYGLTHPLPEKKAGRLSCEHVCFDHLYKRSQKTEADSAENKWAECWSVNRFVCPKLCRSFPGLFTALGTVDNNGTSLDQRQTLHTNSVPIAPTVTIDTNCQGRVPRK